MGWEAILLPSESGIPRKWLPGDASVRSNALPNPLFPSTLITQGHASENGPA
jgi:hypothetical protein